MSILSLKKNNTEKLFSIIFFILLILKVLESFVLKGHGDGVSYHLVLGRYIIEYGFFYAHYKFYLSSLTGLFDYLYLIPQVIFGSGLLAHLSSQFMHFAFSTLLAIFIFSKVFKTKLIFYSVGIFLLSFDRSPDFFIYAKNDGFLAVTFLVGILLVSGERKKLDLSCCRTHALVGVITGLLPLIKMSGLIYALGLTFFYILKLRPRGKNFAFFILFAGLISLPIFIRNWLVIGNPVFPAFLELFPTKITSEMMTFMNSWLKSPASFSSLFKNYLVAFTPKYLGLLSIPLAWLNYRNGEKGLNYLLILIVLFTSCYCFVNPGYPAERFYFGCHFVLIYFIFKSIKKVDDKNEIQARYWLVLLVLLLIDSKIDKVIKRVFHFYPDVISIGLNKELLHKYAPYTKIWNHVDENSRVITDAAPMVYYAPRRVRMYQAGHSLEANFLWTCRDEDLDKYKYFDYALISNGEWNQCTKVIVKNHKMLISSGGYALYRIKDF